MKRMLKKTALLILLIMPLAFMLMPSASAYSDIDGSVYVDTDSESLLDDTLEASKADELFYALPDDTRNLMNDMNIDSAKSVLGGISTDDFMHALSDIAAKALASDGVTVMSLFGMVLLCAAANGIRMSTNSLGQAEIIEIAGTVCVCAAMVTPLTALIENTAEVIKMSSDFMLVYISCYIVL